MSLQTSGIWRQLDCSESFSITIALQRYFVQIITIRMLYWINRHYLTTDLLILRSQETHFYFLYRNGYLGQIPRLMPYESSLWFEGEWTIKSYFYFFFIYRTCIIRTYHLIKILFLFSFWVPLTTFYRKSAVIPFPIVFNNKIYHV